MCFHGCDFKRAQCCVTPLDSHNRRCNYLSQMFMLKFNSCEGFHYICWALFRRCLWPLHHHSLVGSGVEALLPREAVHATDDPGVHLRPLLVTDLSPLASVLHLQEALGDGNPLPVRIRSPDPHILHLHRRTLGQRREEMFPVSATHIIKSTNLPSES